MVLNPNSPFIDPLRSTINKIYADYYFAEDAIFMERNSRDFKRRVAFIDERAEAVCDLLYSRSIDGAGSSSSSTAPSSMTAANGSHNHHPHRERVLKTVFYPKFITPENYRACLRPTDEDGTTHGYGGLFSLIFTTLAASEVFYDRLKCEKGPSLGTNFTLACPYTVLAHWTELNWALEWGVEENLVRVAVGLEDVDVLKAWFNEALDAAEAFEASRRGS